MTMATQASIRHRNQESSIQFMQQEHAATLKALHEEIHKLQSRCTDLTFQLTMNGVSVEEGGDADSRLTDMNNKLKTSQTHNTVLESQLAQQDRKLQDLMQELRTQKKRHLDEMRNASQNVSSLKAEVEAKANNIAFLTTELHRLKVRPSAEVQGPSQEETGAKVVPRPQPQYSHLPTPPRDLLTNSARMRQQGSRTTTRSGVRRVGAIPSPAAATGAGLPPPVTSESEVLDISPFMQKDIELSVSAVEVKKPAPLPPIAGSRSGLKERELHRVIISKKGQLTRPSMPEVATLAVDQINDINWKRPSRSHSCEYK